jgi:hypothetical protein
MIMDATPQYTILRIKRKVTEDPLDQLGAAPPSFLLP